MKILVTNDDGIQASGIRKLAQAAKKFGEVVVVAPAGQCSAMSHRITLGVGIEVKEVSDFPVEGVRAFSVGGTPADCVKVALEYLEIKPDVVLSGVNKGYNAGVDIAYSGTVAAAMEALLKGIPAIAFSRAYQDESFELVEQELLPIMEKLLQKPAGKDKIWNVNFPACAPEECKGILWDRSIAKIEMHPDVYRVVEEDEDSHSVMLDGAPRKEYEEGTDLHALQSGYISIGTITNMILGQ